MGPDHRPDSQERSRILDGVTEVEAVCASAIATNVTVATMVEGIRTDVERLDFIDNPDPPN